MAEAHAAQPSPHEMQRLSAVRKLPAKLHGVKRRQRCMLAAQSSACVPGLMGQDGDIGANHQRCCPCLTIRCTPRVRPLHRSCLAAAKMHGTTALVRLKTASSLLQQAVRVTHATPAATSRPVGSCTLL